MPIGVDSIQFDVLASDPVSPTEGMLWYNTTSKVLKSYQGGQTQPVVAKLNLAATVSPTITDDSSQGYSVGSRWANTLTHTEYVCIDASVGAAVWRLTTTVSAASLADALLSGGAAWDSGLVFNISALTYVINGTFYTSVGGQVTLNAADPSLNRIDVLVADTTGAVTKVTGTPSASPAKPAIGFDQIEITFVTVAAGATTPTGVTVTNVYLENAGTPTEWAASTTAPARINLASTTTPYQGTKDIEATSALTADEIRLTPTANVNVSGYSTLEFALRAKAGWGSTSSTSIWVCFERDGSLNGRWVNISNGTFGFSNANTSTYQIIPIPMTSFGLTDPFVTRIRIYIFGGGTFGFFLDRMRLQTGVSITYVSGTDTNAIHKNAANEISSITSKAVPVSADLIVIEDSAAGFAKKSATLGSLPSSGLTPSSHEVLLQLIHFIDEGPAEGFTTGATKTTTGTVFPTQNLWKRADATKLVEQNITWTGVKPTTIQWKIYAADGTTVLATVTDTITYTGVFETSRTRTIA